MDRRFQPSGPLRGALRPPPDKSISHRAALIGAMADGRSRVRGYLDAADTRSTLAAVQRLGATVSEEAAGEGAVDLVVDGVGLRGARNAEIDVGNAGTLLRLLPGWLAGQADGRWRLDGDESIRRRPVDRVARPLLQMGAAIRCHEDRLPPVEISGQPLRGVNYELPVASAQVKSCVLLAGLLADGETTVSEPVPTRDHTERMLEASGVPVRRSEGGITVSACDAVGELDLTVPGDFSSAAFWLVAATVVPGSEVTLREVGLNPTRSALIGILRRMGADIEVDPGESAGGEPTGGIRVRAAPLTGTEVGGAEIPIAIDELPLVALAGCFAEGKTVIRDAEELRRKESDRVETVAAALRALGAGIKTADDGLIVTGGELRGGRVESHGDHRIAMLGAIAGLASSDGVAVAGMDAAEVSYPTFPRDLATLAAPRP